MLVLPFVVDQVFWVNGWTYSKRFFLLNSEYSLWKLNLPLGNQTVTGQGHQISYTLWNSRFILRRDARWSTSARLGLWGSRGLPQIWRTTSCGHMETVWSPGCQNAPSAPSIWLRMEAVRTWCCLVLTQRRLQSTELGLYLLLLSPTPRKCSIS